MALLSARSCHVLARRTAWLVTLVLVAASCVDTVPNTLPPAITSFTADPPVASFGDAITLAWNVTHATSLVVQPDGVDVTGSSETVVEPTMTTTYTLVASNAFGTSSRHIEVRLGEGPSIQAFGPDVGPVNPGLPSTLVWVVESADGLVLRGPGLGAGLPVDATQRFDIAAVEAGATYTLAATNDFGSAEAVAQVGRSVPALSLVVAGQSNAVGSNVTPNEAPQFITATEGVQMLGNDYVWKPAYEPLDDCAGQLDAVSADPCSTDGSGPGVSFGVSAGNGAALATSGEVFLIPAAKGGSSTDQWRPRLDPYDRTTLFGSAAHRARLAGLERGAPLGYQADGASYGAILWFQGETDSSSLSGTNNFLSKTDLIFDAFHAELGTTIVYAQLARRGSVPNDPDPTTRNLLYQRVRNEQRRMETGAYEPSGNLSAAAEPRRFMVVTHDLPMHPDDGRHLSADGQLEVGRRMALAIREHLLGENVDGTGPRLVSVVHQSNSALVRVRADRPITAPATNGASAYSGYFGVFADGEALAVSSIYRDPGDATVVAIALEQPAVGPIEVRYMPPPGILVVFEPDVIRSASCSERMPLTAACLPMPAFGVAATTASMSALEVYSFDDPR